MDGLIKMLLESKTGQSLQHLLLSLIFFEDIVSALSFIKNTLLEILKWKI